MQPQNPNGTPTFLDLMDIWRTEFNESNVGKYEMYFHDFTHDYLCIKIKRPTDVSFEDHVCIGHLHFGKKSPNYGVEFSGEFYHPEDPEFFPLLQQRVHKKLNE